MNKGIELGTAAVQRTDWGEGQMPTLNEAVERVAHLKAPTPVLLEAVAYLPQPERRRNPRHGAGAAHRRRVRPEDRMTSREDRYFEAMQEARHMRDCLPCLMGRPDLCPDDDEETNE